MIAFALMAQYSNSFETHEMSLMIDLQESLWFQYVFPTEFQITAAVILHLFHLFFFFLLR